jgi:HD superfamily phosphohydrolase
MERHSLRVFAIASELAALRRTELDREVTFCAALLHDIGAYPSASRDGAYVEDGARFAAELLAPFGWTPKRLELCQAAIERHHELRDQSRHGAEVEMIRRADAVDVSAGLLSFGLPKAQRRAIFATIPRQGVYGEIWKIGKSIARDRPGTVLGVFRRPDG